MRIIIIGDIIKYVIFIISSVCNIITHPSSHHVPKNIYKVTLTYLFRLREDFCSVTTVAIWRYSKQKK